MVAINIEYDLLLRRNVSTDSIGVITFLGEPVFARGEVVCNLCVDIYSEIDYGAIGPLIIPSVRPYYLGGYEMISSNLDALNLV